LKCFISSTPSLREDHPIGLILIAPLLTLSLIQLVDP
jgi:hypothetical protein